MKIKIISLLLLLFAFSAFAQEKTEPEIVSLPDAPDSWIINIHQRGGFAGVHKLLATINSDGKYACGENGKVKMLEPNDKNFLELTELLKPQKTDILLKIINEEFAYCSDCLYSTLSFRRQRENVTEGEVILASARKNADLTAKEIAQKVWKAVKCD